MKDFRIRCFLNFCDAFISRWLEPLGFCHHVWSNNLSPIPWSTQCWSQEVGCQHGTLPSSPLLHARVCPSDISWVTTIQSPDCSWTHTTDVWCQEHDGCLWSSSWSLPDCGCHVQRSHVYEGLFMLFVTNRKKRIFFFLWEIFQNLHKGFNLINHDRY